MTAKQHIAEAEKDATECEQQIRTAMIKRHHKSAIETMAMFWLLADILKKQVEVKRMIKQLLA